MPEPLLAFGAHPDDIEFGAGAVIASEVRAGRVAHLAVGSRGEAATHGTPAEREAEARRAAGILGATLEFLSLGGDCHLVDGPEGAIALARVIRRIRPAIVLAPSLVENQHPDHPRMGRMARDAARLARYGGLAELADLPPHAIGQLFFYAVTPEGEPPGPPPVLVDVSDPEVLATWRSSMDSHATQARSRDYVELQLTRARLAGMRAGLGAAVALYPSDPLVVPSLEPLGRGARRF